MDFKEFHGFRSHRNPGLTSTPIHFIHAQFASGCLRFAPAVSIHAKTIYLMHRNHAWMEHGF